MKKAVSVLVIAAFIAAFVMVPPQPAEAGGAEAAIVLGAAALGLVAISIFAKPQPAVAVYPGPPAPTGAPSMVYPPQAGGYVRDGLTIGNGAGFPFDLFVNGQLIKTNIQPGEVVSLQVYGSGYLLARESSGTKFAERSFSIYNGGVPVVLRTQDFR